MNNIESKEFGCIYDWPFYQKSDARIDYSVNEDSSLAYIKFYRPGNTGKCSRISILSPEYIDGSDFELSNEEIDILIEAIHGNDCLEKSISSWDSIIYSINEAREIEGLSKLDSSKLTIPDYLILKKGDDK